VQLPGLPRLGREQAGIEPLLQAGVCGTARRVVGTRPGSLRGGRMASMMCMPPPMLQHLSEDIGFVVLLVLRSEQDRYRLSVVLDVAN